jgi:predicted RNase H-like nuclease (RuvC/YqgF family)
MPSRRRAAGTVDPWAVTVTPSPSMLKWGYTMTDNRRTRQDWNELSRQNEKLQQENELLRYILRSICRTMAQYSNECDRLTEEPPKNPS